MRARRIFFFLHGASEPLTTHITSERADLLKRPARWPHHQREGSAATSRHNGWRWNQSSRRRGISTYCIVSELRPYVVGYLNYSGISQAYREIPAMDQWLPRRVRRYYWKQWKGAHNRRRQLMRQGIHAPEDFCIQKRGRSVSRAGHPGRRIRTRPADREPSRLAVRGRRARSIPGGSAELRPNPGPRSFLVCAGLPDVYAAITQGRSDPGSSPCSTPRQSRAQTSSPHPNLRRLRPGRGVGSLNRR